MYSLAIDFFKNAVHFGFKLPFFLQPALPFLLFSRQTKLCKPRFVNDIQSTGDQSCQMGRFSAAFWPVANRSKLRIIMIPTKNTMRTGIRP